MLQGEDFQPKPSIIMQAFYWLAGRFKAAEISPHQNISAEQENKTIPEDILVAFAAMESSCPEWINENGPISGFSDYFVFHESRGKPKQSIDQNLSYLESKIEGNMFEYRKLYNENVLNDFRNIYKALKSGVKVS
jgi:hypothetical protein